MQGRELGVWVGCRVCRRAQLEDHRHKRDTHAVKEGSQGDPEDTQRGEEESLVKNALGKRIAGEWGFVVVQGERLGRVSFKERRERRAEASPNTRRGRQLHKVIHYKEPTVKQGLHEVGVICN